MSKHKNNKPQGAGDVKPNEAERPQPPRLYDPAQEPPKRTESAMLYARTPGRQAKAWVSAGVKQDEGFTFMLEMLGELPEPEALAELETQAMQFLKAALTRAHDAGLPLTGGPET